ncbi:type II toxin-antitoxin system death-on-curing family toxin [Thermodesulfatator atlanticus]|uniref:type II toxin-antitoxin system death-on-curing family toxin n=1 Tax=Thermodesulfatator atlanticus TaxID=501497 RepID=UPI0003B30346|nr:type II toxin-antitoxin system death-on-curing family toxin [Thermodesulfatator atlanticus]
MTYYFLTLGEVLRIHSDQIKRYGGAPGLRDLNLLKSAIEVPKAGFGKKLFHEDIFDMAAAYIFHIIKNHPFVDGNKRTGVVCALVFLEMHGIEIDMNEDDLVDLALKVAEGKIEKTTIRTILQKHAVTNSLSG